MQVNRRVIRPIDGFDLQIERTEKLLCAFWPLISVLFRLPLARKGCGAHTTVSTTARFFVRFMLCLGINHSM